MLPRRLELEVTEALLLDDAKAVRTILQALLATDVQIERWMISAPAIHPWPTCTASRLIG
jgi:hypothetical protein